MAEFIQYGESSMTIEASTNRYGYRIHVNLNCLLKSITKHAGVTATKAYLYTDGGVLIDSADFVGDVATFGTLNALSALTHYRIEADDNGNLYSPYLNVVGSWPYNNTYVNFLNASRDEIDWGPNLPINIVSIVVAVGVVDLSPGGGSAIPHDYKIYPELRTGQIWDMPFDSPHKQITEGFRAVVVKVHDGDTITLKADFRDFEFPLRLLGIDAPEMNAGGEVARDWLRGQILDTEVDIKIDRKNRIGKYGRLLGRVISKGIDMGEAELTLGLATTFK